MCFPRCQKISFYDIDQPGLLSLIKTKAIQIYLLFEIKIYILYEKLNEHLKYCFDDYIKYT